MDVHRLPRMKISTVACGDPTMARVNTGLLLFTLNVAFDGAMLSVSQSGFFAAPTTCA